MRAAPAPAKAEPACAVKPADHNVASRPLRLRRRSLGDWFSNGRIDSTTAQRAFPLHRHVPERWPHGWPGHVPPPINPAHLIRPNPMYLLTMPERWLFFWCDPRNDGCALPVVEGAHFIDVRPRAEVWRPAPVESIVLAQNKRRPTKYQAFWSELDVPNRWEILDGQGEVWANWEAFQRLLRVAPK